MLITEYMRAMGLLDSARILYASAVVFRPLFPPDQTTWQVLAHQYISHLSSCLDRCGPHMEIPYLRRNKYRPHSRRPSSAGPSSCQLVVLCYCSFWEKSSFGCCSFDVPRTGLCCPCPCHRIISNRRPLHIFYPLSAVLLRLCSQGHLRL